MLTVGVEQRVGEGKGGSACTWREHRSLSEVINRSEVLKMRAGRKARRPISSASARWVTVALRDRAHPSPGTTPDEVDDEVEGEVEVGEEEEARRKSRSPRGATTGKSPPSRKTPTPPAAMVGSAVSLRDDEDTNEARWG